MPRHSAASLHFPTVTRMARLSPPPDLSPIARQIFLDVVGSSDRHTPDDMNLICVHARAVATAREAAEHLACDGHVIDGKPSPWVAIGARADQTILSTCRMLKLSPLARRPNPSRPGKPVVANYYDRTRLERLATERDDGDGA
jgi:phage terminase small subunit